MRHIWGFIVFGLIFGFAGVGLPAQAQTPPTIITFTSDLDGLTVDAAEAGTTTTTLAWETVGVAPDQRISLQVYGRNGWQALLGTENVALPPSGSYVERIQNACGFCSPTYRVAIADAQGRIFDEQIVTLAWQEAPAQPSITRFVTGVERIDTNSIAQRTARITVQWEVANRAPNSNLVFEQVFEDGTSVSVEQPREALWVGSRGQGEIVPVLPRTENYVQLRLRLFAVNTGTLYDEETLIVPLLGAVTVPVVEPTPPPQLGLVSVGELVNPAVVLPEDVQPEVLSFMVTPNEVDRGGALQVYWNVINARGVLVSRLNDQRQPVDFFVNPALAGTWVLTLPDTIADRATFQLHVVGQNDTVIQREMTVQVRCPYTYFFGSDPNAGCPRSGALEVQASYQPFERGFMIWRGDTRQIYVFSNATGQSYVVPDTWSELDDITIAAQPPAGLYEPERGFAKVWLNQVEVMDGLGWATGPEMTFTMRVQESGDGERIYLAIPDGRVAVRTPDTWGFLGG
jgi:hypothetical protein